MADPKRLDPRASGLHRALLSAGERRFEPPPGAFDAVWSGVAAQVIPGAPGAANGAASGSPAAGTTGSATAGTAAMGGAAATGGSPSWVANLGGATLAKWALVVVAAVGATAGAIALTGAAAGRGDPERVPSTTLTPPERAAASSPSPARTETAVSSVSSVSSAAAATSAVFAAEVPSLAATAPTGAIADPFHGGMSAARPRPSTLPEETAVIIRAREDIQRGAPAESLRVLDTFEREHRGGLLGEERELLRVRALAALGDPRAKTRAAAFVARHPQSSYAERFRPFTQ